MGLDFEGLFAFVRGLGLFSECIENQSTDCAWHYLMAFKDLPVFLEGHGQGRPARRLL